MTDDEDLQVPSQDWKTRQGPDGGHVWARGGELQRAAMEVWLPTVP